jgi:hypothetical protein
MLWPLPYFQRAFAQLPDFMDCATCGSDRMQSSIRAGLSTRDALQTGNTSP